VKILKVLVTGGSGNIGLVILETLEKAGYEVIDFDLAPPPDNKYKFIKGNITELKSLEEATKGVDSVIHLAAYWAEGIADYPAMWNVNVTGTFNVLEASVKNKVRKVVYTSSIAASGLATWVSTNHGIEYFPVDEAHPCRPHNLYGTGKYIGEELGRMYTTRSDMSFTALRVAAVWLKNPMGDHDRIFKELIEPYVRNPESVFEKGTGTFGWTRIKDLVWEYVGDNDVAEAFRLALEREGAKFAIYNIGAADTCTDWDSLRIAKFFYPEVPIRDPVAFLIDKKKPLFDISKAQKELGYRPRQNWREFLK